MKTILLKDVRGILLLLTALADALAKSGDIMLTPDERYLLRQLLVDELGRQRGYERDLLTGKEH